MALQIVLNENDLRKMDTVLREKLLKWYFDQERSSGLINHTETIQELTLREDGGRVNFPEFVRAGLLLHGNELFCKTLKRQMRNGTKTHIEAGKVLTDGSVCYRDKRYLIPSKLAVDVVNANGGNTKALNGYDYLFVRVSNKLVSLQELREQFIKQHS
jgi:hypothetical protein